MTDWRQWVVTARQAVGRVDWRGLPWMDIALGVAAVWLAATGWQRVAPPLETLSVEKAAIVRQEAPSADASRVKFVFETATGQIVYRVCGGVAPCEVAAFRAASASPGRTLDIWHDSLRVHQVRQGDRVLLAHGEVGPWRWAVRLASLLLAAALAVRLVRRHRLVARFRPTQQPAGD